MKFYALKHSEIGYLRSKNSYYPTWTFDIQLSKLYKRRSDASNVKNTSLDKNINNTNVVEIEFDCEPKITLTDYPHIVQ